MRPSTSETSVEVPPMSNVMMRSIPAMRAVKGSEDASRRAGQHRVHAELARAPGAMQPPLDCMTCNRLAPAERSRRSEAR